MQRLDSLRNNAQGLARFSELPAGNRNESIRLQVSKIFAKGFKRIQVVLAERKGPGSGGGPSIDQRHLHCVVAFAGVADVRAAILNVQMHLWAFIEMISEIC